MTITYRIMQNAGGGYVWRDGDDGEPLEFPTRDKADVWLAAEVGRGLGRFETMVSAGRDVDHSLHGVRVMFVVPFNSSAYEQGVADAEAYLKKHSQPAVNDGAMPAYLEWVRFFGRSVIFCGVGTAVIIAFMLGITFLVGDNGGTAAITTLVLLAFGVPALIIFGGEKSFVARALSWWFGNRARLPRQHRR